MTIPLACVLISILMLVLQSRQIIQVAALREDLDRAKEQKLRTPKAEKVEVIRMPPQSPSRQLPPGRNQPRLRGPK